MGLLSRTWEQTKACSSWHGFALVHVSAPLSFSVLTRKLWCKLLVCSELLGRHLQHCEEEDSLKRTYKTLTLEFRAPLPSLDVFDVFQCFKCQEKAMCFHQRSQEDRLCSELLQLCLRLCCDGFIPFSLSPGDMIPELSPKMAAKNLVLRNIQKKNQ